MSNKKQVRQRLIAQRQAMSTVTWRQKSDAICCYLQASAVVNTARTILAYASFRQEPDLMPFLKQLCQKNPETDSDAPRQLSHIVHSPIVGIPRCQGKSLIWHQWHPIHSPLLQPGAYGIPEPDPSLPLINNNTLGPDDVILVPAVGCDRHGYRLGYGGGFYDRFLSNAPWNTMTTIGIIFDFAYVDILPVDTWDQPLNGICTEAGLIMINPK